MRVTGFDLGLANCGVVELLDGMVADVDVYSCGKRDDEGRERTIRERLDELEGDLALHVGRADVAVLEAPSFLRDAASSAMLWAVYGIIRGMCRGRARVCTYTPSAWRKLLGLELERAGDCGVRKPDASSSKEYVAAYERAHNSAAAAARKRRKESTESVMTRRFPEIVDRLRYERVSKTKWEHAFDAAGLASAYHDEQA